MMKHIKFIVLLSLFAIAAAVLVLPCSSEKDIFADTNGVISLPEPQIDGGISVEKALAERRSIRSFTDEPLTLEEVSMLLWAAQGITDDKGHRTSPSAMASYPLEVYLLAGNVTGLSPGVYHYSPEGHSLSTISEGNKIDLLFGSSMGGRADWRAGSPAVFIVTGAFDRINRDGQDLSRFAYVEAGTASENLLLEVVSLGLGATYTASFDEELVKEYLELPTNETTIAAIPVGRAA